MTNEGDAELTSLARKVRRLELACVALLGLCAVAGLSAFRQGQQAEVIRAKGLVIVDEQGRERILIGAPIPEVPHRIRTDMEKVRDAWGERFPNFDWFEGVGHSTTGMLILDENGHDRIAVGDPTPDPNIGRRIATHWGITINDEEGFERSGWGYFPTRDSAGLGLDRRSGEGLNLYVEGDGTSGMLLRGGEQSTFVGSAAPDHHGTGLPTRVHGMVLRDPTGLRMWVDAAEDAPVIEMRDRDGETVGRVPGR